MSSHSSAIVAGCVAGAAVSFLLTRAWVQSSTAALEKTLMGRLSASLAAAPAAVAAAPASPKTFPPVARAENQKRILITGGAGFVGSNLVDVLMQQVRSAAPGPSRGDSPPPCVGAKRHSHPSPPPHPTPLSTPPPGPHCVCGGQPVHGQAQEH